MTRKIAVVTGANRGIGLELAKQCKTQDYEVIAVCRNRSQELEATDLTIVDDVDVTSDTSVQQLADQLKGRSVDLLINNAGIMQRTSLEPLSADAMLQQFQVNAVGPLRVSATLLPHMKEGSKIAMITSRMGSIADNTSGGSYGYRMSKASLNIASVSLARDLKSRGIAVAIIHPGYVQTDMTNHSGQISPAESASGILKRIKDLNLENSGTFWHQDGQVLPW